MGLKKWEWNGQVEWVKKEKDIAHFANSDRGFLSLQDEIDELEGNSLNPSFLDQEFNKFGHISKNLKLSGHFWLAKFS